jgi:hypothetical protein
MLTLLLVIIDESGDGYSLTLFDDVHFRAAAVHASASSTHEAAVQFLVHVVDFQYVPAFVVLAPNHVDHVDHIDHIAAAWGAD